MDLERHNAADRHQFDLDSCFLTEIITVLIIQGF